jgi:hypothetical protein
MLVSVAVLACCDVLLAGPFVLPRVPLIAAVLAANDKGAINVGFY